MVEKVWLERSGRRRQRRLGDVSLVVLRKDLPLASDLLSNGCRIKAIRDQTTVLVLPVTPNVIEWEGIR